MATRVKVGFAFFVVFLLGTAAGTLVLSAYQSRIDRIRQPIWTGQFNRERYTRELTEAIRLRPDQMGALNAALNETREEFLALRSRLQPQFEEVRTRSRQRIREILTTDQQPRFDAFLKRWDEERRVEEAAVSQSRTPEHK